MTDLKSLWTYEGADLSLEECRDFFTARHPYLGIEITGDPTIPVSASMMPALMRLFIACSMKNPVKTKAGLPDDVAQDFRDRAQTTGVRLRFVDGEVHVSTRSGYGWSDCSRRFSLIQF
jgi:hypothetical protein